MAELVEGVQYGLSSQGNNSDKSLIFVKLTDSAYRAIESYLKNQSKFTRSPTIQFLGNEGTLTFPSCESSLGQAGFKFSLSTNADIEGPQGSFECVKQNSSTSLEPLGALPCKMRIHAKDDVYDRTRDQLAKAEENQKRNCTREIKPGGPGIGKKVKIKVRGIPARNIGNTVPPVQKEKDLPVLNTRQPPASKPFPSNVKPSTNGYLPAHNSMSSGGSPQNSIRTKPSGNTGGQKTVNTDIMRRPLRERLIHLLAVRPYKKPEVYERLRKDGITDRDRKCVSDVLKQIARMTENTFHLMRNIWNDVQEDWPFYSEQERQMLKRHKPQNLTPPGSSDGGSSGSGHSPTSTHPGSPPPPVSSNLKRPGYFEGADGLPSKKHRVSHYRKPDQQLPSTRTGNSNNNNNNNSSGGAAAGLPSLLDGVRHVNTPERDEEENRDRRPYVERDNLSSDRRTFSEREGPSSDRRFSDRDSASSDRRSLAERSSTFAERRPLSGENVLERRPLAMETESGSSDRRYCGPDRGSFSTADRERRQFASDTVADSVFSVVSNKEMSSTSVHSDTVDRSAVQCFNQSPNTSSPGRSSGLNGSNKTLREESVWGKTESGRVPSPSASARNSGRYQDSRNDRWNGNCNNSSSFSRSAGNGNYNGVSNNSVSGGGSNSSNRNINNNVSNRSNASNNLSHSNSNSDQRNGYSSGHVPSSSNTENTVAATADSYSSPHCQQEAVDQPLNGELPFADYLSNYTKIMNSEQRSKYKADFNADYSEYRRLHSEVEKVSQRFAHLEKSLNQQVKFSSGWKSIQKQIIREYEETKRDQKLQEIKKRFQYLHEKLSHIKRLVSEYDAAQNCN
ncbi:RNA polymerase II elongation factor Ell-like [Schistocerca piceifrons]|uniref:RNA polymerase II elongation factor Ell-like n=1 Tax=Schistocerca piceifrons TaxID=274613 RepID=UPI001F5E53C3|nr:RNA polymerase II elongation factor Ell-like [Schistocerca piceifrons]